MGSLTVCNTDNPHPPPGRIFCEEVHQSLEESFRHCRDLQRITAVVWWPIEVDLLADLREEIL